MAEVYTLKTAAVQLEKGKWGLEQKKSDCKKVENALQIYDSLLALSLY